MNKSVMNILQQVFGWTYVFISLGEIHYKKLSNSFLKRVYHLAFSPDVYESSPELSRARPIPSIV